MNEAAAWLLNIGGGILAAVGERELLHLAPQEELFEVPLSTRHCRSVLPWQEELLPVWNIAGWLDRDAPNDSHRIAGIVGYQSRRLEAPRLGVIALAEPPVRTRVSDSQACELPQEEPGWKAIAISCFRYRGTPVPILDLCRMFTTPPSGFQREETFRQSG